MSARPFSRTGFGSSATATSSYASEHISIGGRMLQTLDMGPRVASALVFALTAVLLPSGAGAWVRWPPVAPQPPAEVPETAPPEPVPPPTIAPPETAAPPP